MENKVYLELILFLMLKEILKISDFGSHQAQRALFKP